MAGRKHRTDRRRSCQGVGWTELVERLVEAIPPESLPLLDEIMDQMDAFEPRVHGFVYWLLAVQDGSSSLPETIPDDFLLAWRNGHAHHPAGDTPIPIRRCEDCWLVLPNCDVGGHGHFLICCPACGSRHISHKKLSGNDVDGWDALAPLTVSAGPRGPVSFTCGVTTWRRVHRPWKRGPRH